MGKLFKTLIVCVLCTTTFPCFSQCANVSNCTSSTFYMAVAALVIAVAALLLAIRNYSISKKNMINSTEDFQIMLDSTKSTIDKDIKNLRRELQRINKTSAHTDDVKVAKESDDEKVEMPSRSSQNRRRSNYRRRPSNNEGQTENTPAE